jgi:hypothetical protein
MACGHHVKCQAKTPGSVAKPTVEPEGSNRTFRPNTSSERRLNAPRATRLRDPSSTLPRRVSS